MNRQGHAPTGTDKDEDSPIKSTRGVPSRKPLGKKDNETAIKQRTNTIAQKGPLKSTKASDSN